MEATRPHRLQPLTPCGSQRDHLLKCMGAVQTQNLGHVRYSLVRRRSIKNNIGKCDEVQRKKKVVKDK